MSQAILCGNIKSRRWANALLLFATTACPADINKYASDSQKSGYTNQRKPVQIEHLDLLTVVRDAISTACILMLAYIIQY
jgi:hypothetical protein